MFRPNNPVFRNTLIGVALLLGGGRPAEAGILTNHAAVFASAMEGVSGSGYHVSTVGQGIT
jgi:hypothetical protein